VIEKIMLLDAERFILHHSEDDINQEGWSMLQFARDKLIYCPQGMRTLFESKHLPTPYRLVYPIRTKKTFALFAPSRFNLHAIVTASASVARRA
jgi:hypothetical protein